MKIQRNESCPCLSGKKYKKCCLLTSAYERFQLSTSTRALRDGHFIIEFIPEVEDECSQALESIEAGDLVGAKNVAWRLAKVYPRNYWVLFLQGVCLASEDNYTDAISYITQALQINPYFAEGYYNLAVVHFKNAEIARALKCFKKVVEIDGRDGDTGKQAYEHLCKLGEKIKETAGCTVDEYVQGFELFNQAFNCLEEQKYLPAINLFQEVLALSANHVQSYANMGLAHSYLGENKKALECLNKALSIDPNYEPALNNLTMISQFAEGQKLQGLRVDIDYYRDGIVHPFVKTILYEN
jgi:tetratricopeptide (TPR) repeat protein